MQPRDRIFLKGIYNTKGIYIQIFVNICICQKLLDHAKQSGTDVFKTASKRAIQNSRII